jgi:hypothetical protein
MKKNSRKQTAKHAKSEVKIKNDAPSAAKWPDFAARAKEIFGDRVQCR